MGSRPIRLALASPNSATSSPASLARANGGVRASGIAPLPASVPVETSVVTFWIDESPRPLVVPEAAAAPWIASASPRNDWSLRRRLALATS